MNLAPEDVKKIYRQHGHVNFTLEYPVNGEKQVASLVDFSVASGRFKTALVALELDATPSGRTLWLALNMPVQPDQRSIRVQLVFYLVRRLALKVNLASLKSIHRWMQHFRVSYAEGKLHAEHASERVRVMPLV